MAVSEIVFVIRGLMQASALWILSAFFDISSAAETNETAARGMVPLTVIASPASVFVGFLHEVEPFVGAPLRKLTYRVAVSMSFGPTYY
jgi:hypothetical protein